MTVEMHNQYKIAVIGLGYVGLPLAVEFSKKYDVIGFDVNADRIAELMAGHDATMEVSDAELLEAKSLRYSSSASDLNDVNIFIVTVPTPVDASKRPDLTPLMRASETVGGVLKRGDIVIYESTVYPGATEEDCVPVLERVSGLSFNTDFFCGYSPERINPGDRAHRLTSIKKVTSGSTPEVADVVDQLYASIVVAGTHKAKSIRVAEAAKVIENTQRDLNIALINELAIIFNKMGLDTDAVLEAAGTKWNFLPFRPGLVGGHCIGIDPYYLTYKAEAVGYYPQVILAGRRINDEMGHYIANQLIYEMLRREIRVRGSNVLILGFAFKENCGDCRNTKVIDIIKHLKSVDINVDVYDPFVNEAEVSKSFGISICNTPAFESYDAVVLAVAHKSFCDLDINLIRKFGKKNHIFYDVKSVFQSVESDLRL